jgi:hypothetical protein
LVILSVGVLSRSPYEFAHHVKIGRDRGSLRRTSRPDGRGEWHYERAWVSIILSSAPRMHSVSAEDLIAHMAAALVETFDPPLRVGLVLVMAHDNVVVRVLASLEIEVESL